MRYALVRACAPKRASARTIIVCLYLAASVNSFAATSNNIHDTELLMITISVSPYWRVHQMKSAQSMSDSEEEDA